MYSECPFCHTRIEGTPINKREASILRTTYKLYASLLVPIPFIGSFIGGKIYDLFSSSNELFYRYICPHCHCCWTSSNNNQEIKIGGNKHLVLFFYRESFVIGSVESDCYIVKTKNSGNINYSVVVIGDRLCVKRYDMEQPTSTGKYFRVFKHNDGLYVGEMESGVFNGWGVCFANNGFVWFGNWFQGKRNGIGYECDFDGSSYKAGFWRQNIFVI